MERNLPGTESARHVAGRRPDHSYFRRKPPRRRVLVPLNVAARHLHIADVLSYRNIPFSAARFGGWLCGKAITVGAHTNDVHTGMIDRTPGSAEDWREGRNLLALGMRLGQQKLKFLSDEVEAAPGLIDVYRIIGRDKQHYTRPHEAPGLPEFVRRQICTQMREFALRDHYGWWGVLRSSLYFVPFFRWAAPHYSELVDDERDARPYCSQAVSHAIRGAGYPLLNKIPDRHMLPGHITLSPLLLEMFTLLPPVEDPQPIEHYYREAAAQEPPPQTLPLPQDPIEEEWNG